MPVIQVHDKQYPLQPGQTRLGTGTGVDVPVAGDESLGVQAIVDLSSDSQASIRRADAAAHVKVNGVPLGVEPTPLIHGDKVEIAGLELLFSDDRKAGATQYVSSSEIAELAQKRSGPARATAATGGRLVSLVDGKEYPIPPTGIVIGRDASSDVVVAQNEVSRRHAGIMPIQDGYIVQDYSTNGVFVNGVRVQQSQMLARSDVVRVGTEEFRFYADLAAPAKTAASATPPSFAGAPAAAPPPAETTSSAASEPAAGTPALPTAPAVAAATASPVVEQPTTAPPAVAATDTRPVLATLEVMNEGVNKGHTYDVRVSLAHVGRGRHNEIAIDDDSVSDTHAKLQRREDGWYVADLGSTNGTYVGGARLAGERKLEGAPDVRFGGVKMVFRARGALAEESKGTRPIASLDRDARDRGGAGKHRDVVARAPGSTSPAAAQGRIPAWIWIVVLLAVAGVAYFVLKP